MRHSARRAATPGRWRGQARPAGRVEQRAHEHQDFAPSGGVGPAAGGAAAAGRAAGCQRGRRGWPRAPASAARRRRDGPRRARLRRRLASPSCPLRAELLAELLGQHRLPDLAGRALAEHVRGILGQHRLDEALQHEGLELAEGIGAALRACLRRAGHRRAERPGLPHRHRRLALARGLRSPARPMRRAPRRQRALKRCSRSAAARYLCGSAASATPRTISEGGVPATGRDPSSLSPAHHHPAILREACAAGPTKRSMTSRSCVLSAACATWRSTASRQPLGADLARGVLQQPRRLGLPLLADARGLLGERSQAARHGVDEEALQRIVLVERAGSPPAGRPPAARACARGRRASTPRCGTAAAGRRGCDGFCGPARSLGLIPSPASP